MDVIELRKLATRKQNAGEPSFAEGILFTLDHVLDGTDQKVQGSTLDKYRIKYQDVLIAYNQLLEVVAQFAEEEIQAEILFAQVLEIKEQYENKDKQ